MFFSLYDFYYSYAEFFLFVCVLIFLLFSVYFSMFIKKGFPVFNVSLGWISFYIIILTIILLKNSNSNYIYTFNSLLVNDILSYSSKILLLMLTIFWISFSLIYVKIDRINFPELWILITFAILIMMILLSSLNLLVLYLGIESQSLIFYILASLKRGSDFSIEASLKYFILNAISSIILLLGLTLLYGFTGLINLFDFTIFYKTLYVYSNNVISEGILFGLVFLFFAFMFKIGMAPLHNWMLDVYEASSSNITAFFSIIPKFTLFVIFSRIFLYFMQFSNNFWDNFLIFGIVLSIFIGSFGALMQYKWKRFIGYSSINHVGFLIIPFLVHSFKSIESLFFYLNSYLVMTIGMFTFFFCICYYSKKENLRYLGDIQMLFKVNPFLALAFIIILFSMSGIPPFTGFFSKMFIFSILLESKFLGLAIFVALFSCFSCVYYIRLIKNIYFSPFFIWPFLKNNCLEQGIMLIFCIYFLSFFYLDSELILIPIKLLALFFNF
uniref:NADH dehydrogenase subunit 2 n=1 Tax=Dixoniella grisea TaxID=35153 RepID=UPI001FCE2366|nr:NADH dehydrogenase subunit 2 [Dixoniella grisea]UNJ18984.1 NADH dehydrogenase subunit 2 [Dixoniella grisea]